MHTLTQQLQEQLRDVGLLERCPVPVTAAVFFAHDLLCHNDEGREAAELADSFRTLLTDYTYTNDAFVAQLKGGALIE